MKLKTIRFFRTLFAIAFFYTLLAGVFHLINRGFMDFPCRIMYPREESCDFVDPTAAASAVRIESLLSTYEAGFSGAGCDFHFSDTDTLSVSTNIRTFNLERRDTALYVDGIELQKGEEIRQSAWLTLDPWTISRLSFTNLGMVSDCESDTPNAQLAIGGNYGSEFSFLKGGILSALTLAGWIGLQILARKKKS